MINYIDQLQRTYDSTSVVDVKCFILCWALIVGAQGDLIVGTHRDLIVGRHWDLIAGRRRDLIVGRHRDLIVGDTETKLRGDTKTWLWGDTETWLWGDTKTWLWGDTETSKSRVEKDKHLLPLRKIYYFIFHNCTEFPNMWLIWLHKASAFVSSSYHQQVCAKKSVLK